MINNKANRSGYGVRTVEDDERRARQNLFWATGQSLVLALVWAALFELDEITRIKTGSKTVLEYIFRPLQNVTQALRAR